MADFSIDAAKKERIRLIAEMGKIRNKIKAFDEFIGAMETSESMSTNSRTADSNKARIKTLIPECIAANGGSASKEQIKAFLEHHSIKTSEGTLNVYMSKDDNIRYDLETKAWVMS